MESSVATYKDLQARVKDQVGRVPKTCWIADVKARHGLTPRSAPNRHGEERVYPCPAYMVEPIKDALRCFGML